MKKKIFIICGFISLFAVVFLIMLSMKRTAELRNTTTEKVAVVSKTDDLQVYKAEALTSACRMEDKIYCAIEKVIKCTMNPNLEGCTKEVVPSFVLDMTDETDRPKNIAFKIEKIKRNSSSANISVYTKSDCDAQWFGLCKGTVIYSLQPYSDGEWAVTNVYALE